MFKKFIIKNNYYKDSITLMSLTNKVNALEGVIDSTLGMATDMNKEIIRSIGFDESEINQAKSSDMMIALKLENESYLDKVLSEIENMLIVKEEDNTIKSYSNTKQAMNENSDINMAVISIPGNHAYLEVKKCLENNINVMLFSDNMSIEEEKKLKELAVSKKLLMMGPDCGTSIINGIGLCFANKIRKGNISIVGASGTGIQEVTVIIDKLGAGITHAIGTGGRDLSEDIGGLMMLQGMEMLEDDEETKIILLISKPPAESVTKKILEKIKQSKKRYVVCFINGKKETVEESGAVFASTLEEGAVLASSLSLNKEIKIREIDKEVVKEAVSKLNKNQKYLRALYCGGTLAAEAEMIISANNKVYSNVSKKEENKLKNPFESKENTIIDLGDDVFTQGKPHPMIDPSIRNSRILQEAKDKEVAIIMLDFELGFGSNKDPVGLSFDTINKAKEIAKEDGREIIFIGYILSTEVEKQDVSKQRELLKSMNIILANTNAEAAKIADSILKEL